MSAPAGDPHDPLYVHDASGNILIRDGKPVPVDQVYGIRNYGYAAALGFDWLYDALSSDLRSRVLTHINRYITTYQTEGFSHDHPADNYFCGYYVTKAFAALATEGRGNTNASADWSDFLDRVHGQIVQPYYAANLSGGGWPEGQG